MSGVDCSLCFGTGLVPETLRPCGCVRARRIADGHAMLVATVETMLDDIDDTFARLDEMFSTRDDERLYVPVAAGTYRALVKALGMVRS